MEKNEKDVSKNESLRTVPPTHSVGRFFRVSEGQYESAMEGKGAHMDIRDIPLPRRSTRGSAGYDFVSPAETVIPPGETRLIPTGIRCEMAEGWVLLIFPRSSFGIRHGVRLANTTGVIDSDYAWAENEGHIMVPLRNPSDHDVVIGQGERFCQGVLVQYGTADEDDDFAERTGGFGSTGR